MENYKALKEFNNISDDSVLKFETSKGIPYKINKNTLVDFIQSQISASDVPTYIAYLTQSGTDAPVAVVKINTIADDLTWSRNGSGDYSLTSAFTVFPIEGTYINIMPIEAIAAINPLLLEYATNSTSDIAVKTGNTASGQVDDLLWGQMIVIKVYS